MVISSLTTTTTAATPMLFPLPRVSVSTLSIISLLFLLDTKHNKDFTKQIKQQTRKSDYISGLIQCVSSVNTEHCEHGTICA